MSVKKKFDKLVSNEDFSKNNTEIIPVSDSEKTQIEEEKNVNTPLTYSFTPKKRSSATGKVYAVGFLRVYVCYLICFALALINLFLKNEGIYNNFPDMWQDISRCVSSVIIFLVPAFIYTFFTEKSKKEGMGLYLFSPAFTSFVILGFFVMILLTMAEKFSLASFFSVTDYAQSFKFSKGDNIAVKIITYAVVPAICEEAFFRGALQTEISKKAGAFAGIFVSALTFAIMHLDLSMFIIYFSSGFILALTRQVCGSVIPAVILHMANNVTSMFLSGRVTYIATQGSANSLLLVAVVLVLLLVAILYLKALETICVKKAISVSMQNKSEEHNDSENLIKFRSAPLLLYSQSGYTLHKFVRVLFSPAIIFSFVMLLLVEFL